MPPAAEIRMRIAKLGCGQILHGARQPPWLKSVRRTTSLRLRPAGDADAA